MENQHAIEILLAEDNMDEAQLVIRSLKKNNLANSLKHVLDGEEALEVLFSSENTIRPRLMLLDLKMPKVGGIEVLRKLREHPVHRKIPIVVLTSSKEESDIVEAYNLGVNAYIVKPVDFEKLSKVITDIGYFWLVLNEVPH